MTPSWLCFDCETGGADPSWAAVDKAAEKHTQATGHSTITRTVGATRRRAGNGGNPCAARGSEALATVESGAQSGPESARTDRGLADQHLRRVIG